MDHPVINSKIFFGNKLLVAQSETSTVDIIGLNVTSSGYIRVLYYLYIIPADVYF